MGRSTNQLPPDSPKLMTIRGGKYFSKLKDMKEIQSNT